MTFVPTDLSGLAIWGAPDVNVWQDGGSTAAVSDGDPVHQWDNRADLTKHWGLGAAGCTLKLAQLGSRPAVRFNNAGWFTYSGGSVASAHYSKHLLVIPRSFTPLGNFLSSASTHAFWMNSTVHPEIYHGGDQLDATASLVLDTPALVGALYDSTTGISVIYINGAYSGIRSATATTSDSTEQLGAFSTGALLQMDMLDHTRYTTFLSRANHKALTDYFYASNPTLTPPTYTTLKTICFAGDSTTRGNGSSGTVQTTTPGDTSYPARTMTILGNYASYVSANTGVGGAFIEDLGSYVGQLPAIWSLLDLGSPRGVCVVWIGTNNAAASTDDAATIETKLQQLAAILHLHYERVLVLDMLDRTTFFTGNDHTSFTTKRTAVNTWLAANWASYFDGFVQVSAIPELADSTNVTYFADGTHLVDAGYQLVAAAVEPVLAGVLPLTGIRQPQVIL